jgi:tetratricopeptide (TPR) repeat protein
MTPTRLTFIIALLAVGCFSLALRIHPWAEAANADRTQTGSVLELLLGDARRLFANHFFVKADTYFHRGAYVSIFDPPREEELHMVSEGQPGELSPANDQDHDHAHQHDDQDADSHESAALATPPEPAAAPEHTPSSGGWIARWNNHFFPSDHSHLGGGEEREMLPWLKLSAELDPHRIESYTVAAFWLAGRLGRPDEAEQFLRLGLRYNPDSPEILLQLGEVLNISRNDPFRARNIWEHALQLWRKREEGKEKPDLFLGEQLMVRLAYVEHALGNTAKAITWLRAVRAISPKPEAIDQMITDFSDPSPQVNPRAARESPSPP